MAAGEGRRLRPLTERWAKPVLPIDGRPVVATLLHELRRAGLQTVWVVVGHLAEQVERLLERGAAFGVDVRYARQPEALGSADAISRALAAGAEPPLVVTAADTVFAPGDIGSARARWVASGMPGGLGVRWLSPPDLGEQTRVRVEGRRIAAIGGPPQTRGDATLTAAPLWFLDAALAEAVTRTSGPPFEAAAAFGEAIAAGTEILALDLGPMRDLTRPEDVIARNFPYLWSRG